MEVLVPFRSGIALLLGCWYEISQRHVVVDSNIAAPLTAAYVSTRRTLTAKQHLHVIDAKVAPNAARKYKLVNINMYVAYLTTVTANKMLMCDLNIGVYPHAARAEVNQVDRTKGIEVVDGLVHGLQRNRRHLTSSGIENGLHSGVGHVAFEMPQNAFALWSDTKAMSTEKFAGFDNGSHGVSLSTMLVNKQIEQTNRANQSSKQIVERGQTGKLNVNTPIV